MSRRLTTEEFVRRAILKHGELYDYTKTDYTSSLEKVTIVCKDHGDFLQTANAHINGRGCPTCANESSKKDQTWTTEKFITKARGNSRRSVRLHQHRLRFLENEIDDHLQGAW